MVVRVVSYQAISPASRCPVVSTVWTVSLAPQPRNLAVKAIRKVMRYSGAECVAPPCASALLTEQLASVPHDCWLTRLCLFLFRLLAVEASTQA